MSLFTSSSKKQLPGLKKWLPLISGIVIFACLAGWWRIKFAVIAPYEPLFSCRISNDASKYKMQLPLFAAFPLYSADTIVIGDSRTYAGIDPGIYSAMTGKAMYNFSTGQGSGGQLLYFIEKLKPLRPRRLIVTLSPLSLRLPAESVLAKIKDPLDWVLFRKVFDETLDHSLHILRAASVSTVKLQNARLEGREFNDLLVSRRDGYFACPFSGYGPRVEMGVKENASDKEYEELLDVNRLAIKNILPLFEKELAALKARGWNVICVRLPISGSLLKIENTYLPAEEFYSICKRSGVTLLDYSNAAFTTHDGSHLSIKSSAEFTYQLTDDLLKMGFVNGKKNYSRSRILRRYLPPPSKEISDNKISAFVEGKSPAGEASASSCDSEQYAAWKAMNGTNSDSSDCWASKSAPSENSPQWLEYRFHKPQGISGYSIVTRNDIRNASPRNWSLKASNDGKNWVILDNKKDQFSNSRPNQKQRFKLKQPSESYAVYRLEITARNRAYFVVDVGEFELW